jgi:hypothetical protein
MYRWIRHICAIANTVTVDKGPGYVGLEWAQGTYRPSVSTGYIGLMWAQGTGRVCAQGIGLVWDQGI